MKELDEHLNKIRDVAKSVQMKQQQMRLEKHPTAGINKYQVGDLVLENANTSKFKKFKLQAKYHGPFEITMIYKADITLKDLVTGDTKVVHMEHIKPFYGSW